MLEIAQARAIVLQHTARLTPETRFITDTLGQTLAEDILADSDSPPFDKALMDGFAVRVSDIDVTPKGLPIYTEISAGHAPGLTLPPGQAARIMTGAPLPIGADAVVMIERCTLAEPGVLIHEQPKLGQHILRQGKEMRQGEAVLPAGCRVSPATLGLLATLGRSTVQVIRRPRVAILPTGNELVPVGQPLQPGQIRNSNGPMLFGQVWRAGGEPLAGPIVRDRFGEMSYRIRAALESADVVLLSGGVSMGKFDLVPSVLTQLGVTAHFHQVRLKPGKPLLFGTLGAKLVFGLPGNPVSSFVCFELFARPALKILLGEKPDEEARLMPLLEPFYSRTDRPTFHPAQLAADGVRLLPWFGSPDLRGLASANALAQLEPGERQYSAGERVPVLVFPGGT